jgi:hypothetical protein
VSGSGYSILPVLFVICSFIDEEFFQAFPFDPNPDWSHFYSGGAEILEYMQKTVKKWALDRDVQLNTRVVGAYWQEDRSQWKLLVEHEDVVSEEYADILISGQGFLKYVFVLCSLFTFPEAAFTESLVSTASGNGPPSKDFMISKASSSIPHTGITPTITPTNVSR